MVYAFLQHYYSDDRASVQEMLNIIEYAPHQDPHWDPFSIVHNVSQHKRQLLLPSFTDFD